MKNQYRLAICFLFVCQIIFAQNQFCQDIAIAYSLPDSSIEQQHYKTVINDIAYVLSSLCSDSCTYINLVEINELLNYNEQTMGKVNDNLDAPIVIKFGTPKNLLTVYSVKSEINSYAFFIKIEELKKVNALENTYTLGKLKQTPIIHLKKKELLAASDLTRKRIIGEQLYFQIGIRCNDLKNFIGIDESGKIYRLDIMGPDEAKIYVDGEFKKRRCVSLNLPKKYYRVLVTLGNNYEWYQEHYLEDNDFILVKEKNMSIILHSKN